MEVQTVSYFSQGLPVPKVPRVKRKAS